MADEKLTIVVGAKDNTGPALGGIKKSISGIGDVAKTAIGMALGGVLLKIPGMARDAGRAISDMVMDAAKVNDARLAFQGLGGDIEALRKGTLGMVADSELMLTYNEAAMLVGKTFADELPSAMGYLGKVAAATGQDMGFMMDSLTKGVGRLSPMILDNLGIQVSLADANQEYAATLGKTVGELTKGEQQTALMNQVMEKLAKNTADMPDIQDSLTTSMARVKASFANVKDTIGQALLPVMADLGKQFADFIQDHGPQIKEAIQKFSEFITDKLIPAIKTLYEWIRDKLMPVLQGIWGFIKDNMEPILAGLAVVLLAVVVPAFIAWAAAAISAAAATILAIAPVAIPILAIAAVIALLVAAWKKGWFNDIALFLLHDQDSQSRAGRSERHHQQVERDHKEGRAFHLDDALHYRKHFQSDQTESAGRNGRHQERHRQRLGDCQTVGQGQDPGHHRQGCRLVGQDEGGRQEHRRGHQDRHQERLELVYQLDQGPARRVS